MTTILLFSCLKFQLINKTPYPWNEFDRETMSRAVKGCARIYKDAPCVKTFTKTGKLDYQVVCTKELRV